MPQDPYEALIKSQGQTSRPATKTVDPYESLIKQQGQAVVSAAPPITNKPRSSMPALADNPKWSGRLITDPLPEKGPFAELRTMVKRPTPVDPVQQEFRAGEAVKRQAIRDRVFQERNPSPTDIKGNIARKGEQLLSLTNPVQLGYDALRPERDIIDERVETEIESQRRAETPEVIERRKSLGRMPSAVRAQVAPMDRFAGNLMHTAAGVVNVGGEVSGLSGIARAVGIQPEKIKDYLDKRGQLLHDGSSIPLDEAGKEVERSIPEKVATSLGDLGYTVAQLATLKRLSVTKAMPQGLSMAKLMALETGLRNTHLPAKEQVDAIANATAMGRILDGHLGRAGSAVLFGAPTAVSTGTAALRGQMSPLDAALETGIQAGVGGVMGKRKGVENTRSVESRPKQGEVQINAENQSVRIPETFEGVREVGFQGADKYYYLDALRKGEESERRTWEPLAKRAGASSEEIANARQSQDAPAESTVPESRSAVTAQLAAMRNGERDAVLLTPNTPRPPIPPGYRTAKTDVGTFIYDPKSITEKQIKAKVVDGSYGRDLLGNVAPKPEAGEPVATVVARDAQGKEVQAAVVPPEAAETQAAELTRQHPQATVEVGGPEKAVEVIAERLTEPVHHSKSQPRTDEGKFNGPPEKGAPNESTEAVSGLQPDLQPKATGAGEVTKPVSEPSPSSTAANRASVTADREARGEPPIPRPERKADTQLLEDAKAANEADRAEPLRLVDQVLNGNKGALSDKETVQLDLHQQELKNKYDAVNKELADATEPSRIRELSERSDTMEREMSATEEAMAKSGTEKGRALRAQRVAIDQDYRLLTMVAKRAKALGRQLTAEERATIKTQSERIAKLETELATANERSAKIDVDRAAKRLANDVARESRQQQRGARKQSLDDEAATLKQLIAAEWKKVGGANIHGMAAVDAEGQLTKLVLKLAKNRLKANVGLKAETLVDDIHGLLKDVADLDKRRIAEIVSGYGRPKGTSQRSDVVKQLDGVKSELRKLLAAEDIASGKRLSPKDKTRQTQLLKQEADLQRRIAEGDFSKTPRQPPQYTAATLALQKQLERTKTDYNRANYRATRGRFGTISDELAKAANIPKTIKSMGDISAMFRQGGFYGLTHPVEGLAKPTRNMLRSFTEVGFRNVENAIKSDTNFDKARKSGVEFTGVDKADPNLSKREEGYLGKEHLQYIPGVKQVSNFSERTFVSFLDSQRMHMFNQMVGGLPPAMRNNPAELKAIAKLINIGTGRGTIPKFAGGNQNAPLLNLLMFSPRLVASRVQLLNNMVNPVTMARMPPGARSRMIKDNVKFLGAVGTTMALAKALGGTVNTDPDDGDFLKIRFGKTVYDNLTGLQQPLRYLINMTRAATGGEDYEGKSMKRLTDPFEPGSFTRSKLSPLAGAGVTALTGKDYMGQPLDVAKEARDLVTPLPVNDFVESIRQEGLLKGFVKATPSLTGIGVQTYTPRQSDKAERSGFRERFASGNAPSKQELADKGFSAKQIANLEKEAGLTPRQITFSNVNADRVNPTKPLDRFERMSKAQQDEVRSIMSRKAHNLLAYAEELRDNASDEKKAERQAELDTLKSRLAALGITPENPRASQGEKLKRGFKARMKANLGAP